MKVTLEDLLKRVSQEEGALDKVLAGLYVSAKIKALHDIMHELEDIPEEVFTACRKAVEQGEDKKHGETNRYFHLANELGNVMAQHHKLFGKEVKEEPSEDKEESGITCLHVKDGAEFTNPKGRSIKIVTVSGGKVCYKERIEDHVESDIVDVEDFCYMLSKGDFEQVV
jgi:hypothetical protein